MKLFIDTINTHFFISLIDNDKTVAYIKEDDLVKKSDFLPTAFKELLSKANIQIEQIREVYVTDGPGSFMGIRAGLTFAKVLCYVQNKKLFTANNFIFMSNGKDGEYFIDAKSKSSFKGIVKNGEVELSLTDGTKTSEIDYEQFIENPNVTLDLFMEVKDVVNYEPKYYKDPQIGGA